MASYDIGTGETYTTVQGWESGVNSGTLSEIEYAECKGERFDENVIIDGGTASASAYLHLRGKAGARHDGRAHEVSGAGNARIYPGTVSGQNIRVRDDYVRISWMQIGNYGNHSAYSVAMDTCSVGADFHFHHNVSNGDGDSTSYNDRGVYVADADCEGYIYRNIIYGRGGHGIDYRGNTTNYIHNNTVYQCNQNGHGSVYGIYHSRPGGNVKNNCSFDNGGGGDYSINASATTANNFSSDTTSPDGSSYQSKTATDNFVNATTTWSSCDLLADSAATDILDAGDDLGSPYDVDIEGDSVSGTWDCGADEYLSTGTTLTPDAAQLSLAAPQPALTFGGVTMTPGATAVSVVAPQPSVSLGAVTLTPDAAASLVIVPNVSVLLGAQTLTPDAAVVPLVAPSASVSLGALTLSPDTMAAQVVVPHVTVDVAGVTTLTPDAVAVPIAVASSSIVKSLAIVPDSASVSISSPTPTVRLSYALQPDASSIVVAVPIASVSAGAKTISPDAIQIVLIAPSPSIEGLIGADLIEGIVRITQEHDGALRINKVLKRSVRIVQIADFTVER